MVSTGPLLCALLAAARLAIGTVGGCIGAETRVGGIDLALSTVIRGVEAASSGTRLGIGHSYDDTASDRANQYNGRVFDPGTGLHDYGARMYWPQIGRFISADSYQGDIGNPASLNRYSYVHNNPYKYTDPSGHQEVNPAEVATEAEPFSPMRAEWEAWRGELLQRDPMNPARAWMAARDWEPTEDDVAGMRAQVFTMRALQESPDTLSGIYQFPDAANGGKPYVGQSLDIMRRLIEHESDGRITDPENVPMCLVPGTKLDREIAEYKRIREITAGKPARKSDAVSNKVDPIGPKRQEVLKEKDK